MQRLAGRKHALLFTAVVAIALPMTGCGSAGSAPSAASNGVQKSAPAPPPGVTLSGDQLNVVSSTLVAKFNQAALISLTNLTTNENYIASAGPNWVDLTLLENNGENLSPGAWTMNADNKSATIQFSDSQRVVKMTAGLANDDIFLRFEGSSSAPGVVSVTWGIFGLNLAPGRLVIPAQGGTYFDANSKPNFQGLDYPVHWENQMVIYQGAKGSVLMYANDPVPTYKRLHASKQTGSLDMAFEMFAPGPWPSSTAVPPLEWRLHGYSGDWRPAADVYKSILQAWHPFTPADGARAWIKNARGVVIFQTLDYQVLDRLAQEVIPDRTVLLLTNWRQQPFDFDYPDYTPAPEAQTFVERAHQLGFRVMLHVNLLGISEVNPAYANFKQCQIRTADTLAPIGWLWDDFPSGDPHRVAYISPACSAYRKSFIASVKPAVDALQPDALHLDAGGAIVNDGNGLIEGMNGMQGMIELQKEIVAAFPNVVLGGESTNEIIGPYNWLAQRWPAPSPAHPISTYLFGDQLLFYGFLDQPAPEEAGFGDYLYRYEGLGVAPVAFDITSSDLDADRTRTHQVLDYLKILESNEFHPDWNGDWTGLRFRQVSADAKSTLSVQDDGTLLQVKQDSNTFYQRIHDGNSFQTPFFIDNWPAYDATTLYGTDPNHQYWIGVTADRPSGEMHFSSMPTNFQVGLDTYRTSSYGLFDITGVDRNWFDFVADFPGAKIGTIYNLKEYPVINGAVIEVGRARVGGILYDSLIFEHPPYKRTLGGSDFIEYTVPVPVAPKVLLQFSAALVDGSDGSDGVLFGIQVNGQTQWKATVLPGTGWTSDQIDLTSFAGQTIKLRLLTHPGLKLDANFDQACWNALKIVTDYSTTANFDIQLPSSTANVQVTPNASIASVSGQDLKLSAPVPGKFAVFTEPPPAVDLGKSLLDFPITTWQATYGGLPLRSAYEDSGTIGDVSSNGVTKTAIAATPPRRGVTILTSAVTLPAGASVLNLTYGLADAPAGMGTISNYSGVIFIVRANGTELLRQRVETAGWNQNQINISAYGGKPVVFEFIADSDSNQLFDFAHFADLTIQ